MGTYSFTGAPVFITVGTTGVYDINAFGAQGGGSPRYGTAGGNGAEEGGNVTLTMGEKLEIVVGGMGVSNPYERYGGGGGGGTFVLGNTGAGYVPLVVAGGGGGAYTANGGAGTVGASGNGSGGKTSGSHTGAEAGGGTAVYAGAGGSGVKSDGAGYDARGGDNKSGAYAGGAGYNFGGNGGFGGGGGGDENGGGGGGGYTGGSGGNRASGVGGTSFDSGTAIAAQTIAGNNSGNGSLTITAAACYCPGTLVLTSRSEMPVEILAIGDTVITASGDHRPIKWIGRRSYGGRFLRANAGVQPIRFGAGSLGDGLPRRDLLVSPEHAMFLDGLLVPARCLVNGSTIVQERGLERVDYFHVELDSHDVLLAEGAPSESFIDDDSRGVFHNAHEFTALYPDARRPDEFCARRVEGGFEVEAIRRRLAVVAGEMAVAVALHERAAA